MKKIFTLAAFAAIVASCSQSDDIIPKDDLKDTPITVTAGVAELTTRAGYETNKDDDTKSVLPEKFYLSITQDTEDATSPYNYTNVLMTKAEDDNTYSAPAGTTLLWKDENHAAAAVNAYTTDGTTFAVKTDQSTAENVIASDLLGAVSTTEGDVTVSGNNIGIRFRHLLCKLDVTFLWGTEFITENKSIKSVVYEGFGTDVTLDRAACTLTNGTTTDKIQPYVTTADEGKTYLSEAIFAPHVGAAPSIVITAVIDDVERDFAIGVNPPAAGFASGNRYTMNVIIGGTSVENALVTANIAKGWEDGDANGDENGTTGNMETN